MKILMYVSVLLILFFQTLSPVNSAAHGLSIPTQWEAEGVNVYDDEIAFVRIPAQIGDKLGGVTGGVAGIALGLPAGTITSIFTANPFYIVLVPACCNALLGYAGRKAGSAVFGSPFYVIAKVYQHISVAVNEAIFYSDIMNKYFRS